MLVRWECIVYCVWEDIKAVVKEEDEEQDQESEDAELGASPNLLDISVLMLLQKNRNVPTILRVISDNMKKLLSLRISAPSTSWCSWAKSVRSQVALCKEICPLIFISRTYMSSEKTGLTTR